MVLSRYRIRNRITPSEHSDCLCFPIYCGVKRNDSGHFVCRYIFLDKHLYPAELDTIPKPHTPPFKLFKKMLYASGWCRMVKGSLGRYFIIGVLYFRWAIPLDDEIFIYKYF